MKETWKMIALLAIAIGGLEDCWLMPLFQSKWPKTFR